MKEIKTLFKLNMIFSRLLKDYFEKPYEVLYVSKDVYRYHNLKDVKEYKGAIIKQGAGLSSDTIVACYFNDKLYYE
tara:strand:- start:486 stop:713 length:228 start_codon:yes stop_codon:yes gene_type:complete